MSPVRAFLTGCAATITAAVLIHLALHHPTVRVGVAIITVSVAVSVCVGRLIGVGDYPEDRLAHRDRRNAA